MTFSWRTRLSPGGSNHRFYMSHGEPWVINAKVARDMLQELDDLHALSADQAPGVRPEILFSRSMTQEMRHQVWSEIRLSEDRWSEDAEFVVAQDPLRRNLWRKIGIVDPATGRATFRSTTLDASYSPRKQIPSWREWHLDNSMLDAGKREMGAFLDLLDAASGQ